MAQPKRMLMKELYSPQHGTYLAANSTDLIYASIVLIHGLNGDPIETWRHQDSKKLWPQEFLPLQRPNTRVLSYGYNGDIYLNNSAANIRDMARSILSNLDSIRRSDPRRPVIFVAHCLGGLIVKQALCFARAEPRFYDIGSATKAVFFFGTPHSGANRKDWKRIAESYSVLSPHKGPVANIVNAITTSAPKLGKLCDDFVELTAHYLIVTWYETVFWPGTKRCIVDQTSSRMMSGADEESLPVEADHVNMCRFAEPEDPTLRELLIGEASGIQERTAGAGVQQSYTIIRERVRVTESERQIMVGGDLTGQVYSQQRREMEGGGGTKSMRLSRVQEVEDDSDGAIQSGVPRQIEAATVRERESIPGKASEDPFVARDDSGPESRRPNFLKRFAGRLRTKQTLVR
ncbi:hypothetical protein QBC41DRAFT_379389 [Cercophora samala]|uniref:DUF676 domain-containing protein n=1 Tax=Cercophora samala TaxID=330535 RepID=A0AA40D8C0_9PEZI|nr:hypothetical protein QBC41DRAFT_379389 [Cercophora samala]